MAFVLCRVVVRRWMYWCILWSWFCWFIIFYVVTWPQVLAFMSCNHQKLTCVSFCNMCRHNIPQLHLVIFPLMILFEGPINLIRLHPMIVEVSKNLVSMLPQIGQEILHFWSHNIFSCRNRSFNTCFSLTSNLSIAELGRFARAHCIPSIFGFGSAHARCFQIPPCSTQSPSGETPLKLRLDVTPVPNCHGWTLEFFLHEPCRLKSERPIPQMINYCPLSLK